MGPIVLLTDFGTGDWFAGTLEGVIASLAPSARVIHLTHGIPRGDVRAGAFSLWAAHRHFPEGSVFVAVVDPGVGGPRDALLVEAHGRTYLGPDNGILSWATRGALGRSIRVLADPRFRTGPVSRTFHGRDVFAPAAAHLHAGAPPRSFGPARKSMAELPPLRASLRRGAGRGAGRDAGRDAGRGAGSAKSVLAGTVAYVDAFGNAITSIRAEDLRRLGRTPRAAHAGGAPFPWKRFYADAGPGGRLSLVGSCGLVELAVNGGSAAAEHNLRVGDAVLLS